MPIQPNHRATACYVGETTVEFTCLGCGHVWREDMRHPKGKRYPHIRLGAGAVAQLAGWWKRNGHVNVTCPRCRKAGRG